MTAGRVGAAVTIAMGVAVGWIAGDARMRGRLAAARLSAGTDPLTGVANRVRLVTEGPRILREAAQAGEPAAVVLVDLVGFKQVNDTHGHATGDAVLVEVGQRLSELPGVETGGLAVRLGGDEFAVLVLCPQADSGWLAGWLDRAHEALTAPVQVGEVVVEVGATLGGVVAAGESLAVLLHRADAAMYGARAAGTVVREAGCGLAAVPSPRPAVRRRDQSAPNASAGRREAAGGAR